MHCNVYKTYSISIKMMRRNHAGERDSAAIFDGSTVTVPMIIFCVVYYIGMQQFFIVNEIILVFVCFFSLLFWHYKYIIVSLRN